MSVTGAAFISHRSWNGFSDPALPIGYWFIEIESTGNATGGDHSADVQFSIANASTLNANLYSLEDFYMNQSQAATTNALITTANMDNFGGGPMNHRWTALLVINEGGLPSGQPFDMKPLRGTFLGAQRLITAQAVLSTIIDNVNGNVLRVGAQGYYWSPRAILQNGGLQRPPRGIYGL